MARRYQNRTSFRDYTGDNPVYTFAPTGFDPIQQEAEKGYRTGQNIDKLAQSISGVLETNRKNKEILYSKIPYGKDYNSDLVTAEAEKKIKEIDETTAQLNKKHLGFLTIKDRQEIQNKINAYNAWDKQVLGKEKAIGETYKMIGDPTKRDIIDSEASMKKIQNLEKNILEPGWVNPSSLVVLKPKNYTKQLGDAIDEATKGLDVVEVESLDSQGNPITTKTTKNRIFANQDGSVNEYAAKEFLKANATPDMHYAAVKDIIENNPDKIEVIDDFKEAWLNNEVDLMDIATLPEMDEMVINHLYNKHKDMFDRTKSEYSKEVGGDDTDGSGGKGLLSPKNDVKYVGDVDLSARSVKGKDAEGNVTDSDLKNIKVMNAEEVKGDPLLIPKISATGAYYMNDLLKNKDQGFIAKDFYMQGVGIVDEFEISNSLDKMLQRKDLSDVDRKYLEGQKKQFESQKGKLKEYAYGTIDDVFVIVPYEQIKGRLSDKFKDGYTYGSNQPKQEKTKFVGVPSGGFN